jgi:hypothetical protein
MPIDARPRKSDRNFIAADIQLQGVAKIGGRAYAAASNLYISTEWNRLSQHALQKATKIKGS